MQFFAGVITVFTKVFWNKIAPNFQLLPMYKEDQVYS